MSSAIVVALRIAASPERVFAAFTEEIAAWWRPNGLFAFAPGAPGVLAFEPGIGGRFTETNADGRVVEVGRVTAWAPPTHLAFTWRQASFAPEMSTQVEVRFEPVETGVTVEHRGWESVPPSHAARHNFPDAIFLQRHGAWWRDLLLALAAHAA